MLSVFFVSDAFCHSVADDPDHTHDGTNGYSLCPDGPVSRFSNYPKCAFAAISPPAAAPQTPAAAPQTPGTNPPLAISIPQSGNDRQPANDGAQDIESPLTTQIAPAGIGVQPAASTTQRRTAALSTLNRIRITEYMCSDWSYGVGRLPQWIELYNPNTVDVNMTGYKFFYAEWNSQARKYEIHEKPITLKITIPAKDAIILATRKARK